MANVANLRINAVVNDQATPSLKRINGALNGLNSGMSSTSGGALGAARALTSFGGGANTAAIGLGVAAGAAVALVAGTAAVIKASIAAASTVEGYRNTLLRLTGDAAKADAVFNKLRDFADWSPFDDASVMMAAQRLLGAGVAADDLTKVMTALSDVSGDSAETFQRASLAFSQMALKGKVSQEELNQLAEAGIPAQKLLADAMGVSTSALAEMAQKGQLTATKTLPLLVQAIEGKFGGATERASQSVKGLSSTLDAKLTRSLATLGTALEPLTKDVLRGFTALIDDLVAGISELTATQEFQDFLAAAGDAFKALLEVLRPIMRMLFELGRAVLPFVTIALRAFATVFRILGGALQFVARLLKPVFEFLRMIGNALKAGIDWVMAWGARLGEWPKIFSDVGDKILELLKYLGNLVATPSIILKVAWSVAALVLPTVADYVIKVAFNVAEFVVPSFAADTSGFDAAIDAMLKRIASLTEPTQPHVVTVTGNVIDAMDKVKELDTAVTGLVSPMAPYIVTVASNVASAILEIASVGTALSLIPAMITVGLSLDTTGVGEAIRGVIDSLAGIPRMITTVHNVVQATTAIADSTGPNATGLSVPPSVINAGSIADNTATIAAAAAGAALVAGVGMTIANLVGAPAGGGCFVASTRVNTSKGLIRIADIVVGDYVEVYSVANAVIHMAPVCETLVHEDHPVWHLRISGDDVATTAEHPFLTPDGWRRADDLRSGHAVVTGSGIEIVEESWETTERETVYNLHVDHPDHNFMITSARFVVHNFKTIDDYFGRGATGGIVTRPTMALIGEAGPEALVPLNQMPGASPLGGLGGVNIDNLVINVSGFADGATAGRAAADAFRRQLGLQRRLPFGTA